VREKDRGEKDRGGEGETATAVDEISTHISAREGRRPVGAGLNGFMTLNGGCSGRSGLRFDSAIDLP
jgi:hypothetical protein